MIYLIFISIAKIIFRVFFRIQIRGRENIPKQNGKLILCSNHISVADPILIGVGFHFRRIYYMAKSELFEKSKVFGFILKLLGAFPVNRDNADAYSVKTAISILKSEKCVGIFPEGRCVYENTPFKAKSGVTLLAMKTKSDILPVSIYCDGRVKLFKRITIRFGSVIKYTELGFKEETLRECRNAKKKIAIIINKQLEETHK